MASDLRELEAILDLASQESFFRSGVRGARSLNASFDAQAVKSVREAERSAEFTDAPLAPCSLIMPSAATLELCIRICDMASAGASFGQLLDFIFQLEQPESRPQTVH